MKTQRRSLYIWVIVAIFSLGAGAALVIDHQRSTSTQESQKFNQSEFLREIETVSKNRGQNVLFEQETPSATLVIGDIYIKIPIGATLYEVMESINVPFEGREYPGFGFFVTKIGILESSNGKHLMYFINNKEASVGVSSYIPKDGDVIEWKLQ